MIEKAWVDTQTEHMQNIFDEHGVNVTELMLIGQIFALLFTWQIGAFGNSYSPTETFL